MDLKNPIIQEDLERIINCKFIPWKELDGKTVFITGATGLIGKTIVFSLLSRNKKFNSNIRIIVLVRDLQKARDLFEYDELSNSELLYVKGDVEDIPEINDEIDYIIHAASPTNSRYMKEKPVETIRTIAEGTRQILELAKKKKVTSCLMLSSMEVYGEILTNEVLSENDLGRIDLYNSRSSYPEAKRLAELLCYSYYYEYDVPVTVIRLAQTFGPGVLYDDQRVFAYMARCACEGRDIVLQTKGEKENMYLYTADAVTAIILLLLCGERGEVYNASNPETYCSIKQMADLVAETVGMGKIETIISIKKEEESRFRPDSKLYLDVSKLTNLGWFPEIDLEEMYHRMIHSTFRKKVMKGSRL